MTNEKKPITFCLNEVSEHDLPDDSTELLREAKKLVKEVTTSWTKGKVVEDRQVGTSTATYHTKKGHDFWIARVSIHPDVSYETFKKYVLDEHTKYEQEYIDLLHSYEAFDVPSHPEWYRAAVHYKFPRMFSDRQMSVLVLSQETIADEEFYVLSFPSDGATEEQYTRAEYCSIESVVKRGDEVIWTVLSTSDSKGNIPRWVQNRSVTDMVAMDVPSFVSFVRSREG